MFLHQSIIDDYGIWFCMEGNSFSFDGTQKKLWPFSLVSYLYLSGTIRIAGFNDFYPEDDDSAFCHIFISSDFLLPLDSLDLHSKPK